ncbi:hypothetical protein GQ53DRAFT_835855 [Thozetella sp. PMI_491]|nr:hypothetical protein GQ53DRAFT_835855 [Thozetella sp. PMI_491]
MAMQTEEIGARQSRGTSREGPNQDQTAVTNTRSGVWIDSLSDDPSAAASSGSSRDGRARSDYSASQTEILPEEEQCLLQKYLEVLNDALPIFSPTKFYTSFDGSVASNELKLSLVLVTAKLTGFTFASTGFNLDASIDFILSSASLEESMFSESPSLHLYRKFCLLVFYEFHQFPGPQAWMLMTKLTRSVYWIGLDRLDDPASGGHSLSHGDIDEWRLVWWAVFRFDSYANIAVGMPYIVDECVVRTALLRDREEGGMQEGQTERDSLFLPAQPERLWELPSQTASDSLYTSSFNLHILSTTVLRYIARTLRTANWRRGHRETASVPDVERYLATFRLSLPVNFLNPMRNAFLNETSANHHARLVTMLHLLMARLLTSLALSISTEGHDWTTRWQQVLETCQDIASVAEQWSSTFTLSVDPAISFILFTALIFVDVHKKYHATPAQLVSSLEHCETVLLLQLEQFASTWTLPRLLILSSKSFKESLAGPLVEAHIRFILSHFEAPLHPRWIKFLSSAQADLEALDAEHPAQRS